MARIETVLALLRLKEDGKKYHIVLLLAADFYRVVLTAIDDNEVTSYINAVHIPVSSATKNPAGGKSLLHPPVTVHTPVTPKPGGDGRATQSFQLLC